MNKCFVCCGLAAVLITLPASAQQSWTLRQCADYAVEHNISIKQKGNHQTLVPQPLRASPSDEA